MVDSNPKKYASHYSPEDLKIQQKAENKIKKQMAKDGDSPDVETPKKEVKEVGKKRERKESVKSNKNVKGSPEKI